MLSYEDLKRTPKTLMAMTSLTPAEFDELLVVFATAWDEKTGRDPAKGGRPPVISSVMVMEYGFR